MLPNIKEGELGEQLFNRQLLKRVQARVVHHALQF